MTKLSEMITVKESNILHPDCVAYEAELRVVSMGYISKETNSNDQFGRLKKYLVSMILEIVNKDVIDTLDKMRKDLYEEARGTSYDAYSSKMEATGRLGKIISELRGEE